MRPPHNFDCRGQCPASRPRLLLLLGFRHSPDDFLNRVEVVVRLNIDDLG